MPPAAGNAIVAEGSVVSSVQVKVAGEASVLPAPSAARTSKVWEAWVRPLELFGEVHALHEPPSSRH